MPQVALEEYFSPEVPFISLPFSSNTDKLKEVETENLLISAAISNSIPLFEPLDWGVNLRVKLFVLLPSVAFPPPQ